QVARQRDHTMQLGVEALDAVQIDAGEALAGEPARLHPARQLAHRSEGKVAIVGGQRAGVGLTFKESIARRPFGLAGQYRIPPRRRCYRVIQRQFAWSRAEFVDGSHLPAPVAGRHLPGGWAEWELDQLLSFGECGGRYRRSHRWRGAEGRRRTGWRSRRSLRG